MASTENSQTEVPDLVSNPKDKKSVFLISECGINANGSTREAEDQILRSKEAGADAVKFQVYDTDQLFDKSFKYYEDSKRGMFSQYQHNHLAKVCKNLGIEWFASPFHDWAVDLCEELGVKRYKVASISVKNRPLLEKIASTKKPVILSCGSSLPNQVEDAIDIIGKDNIQALLYCITKYPTPKEDFRFWEMFRLAKDHEVPVGLSSHCPEIWPAVKAVALGATVIEQHTTVSRDLPGCDQPASLTYEEFAELVKITRKLEKVG